MMTQVSQELLTLAEKQEPTEQEAQLLPARIADDGGEHDNIALTQAQVDVLKAKKLIYYCGCCTQTTLNMVEGDIINGVANDDYAAREYHTVEALCDVEDGNAYLEQIIAASEVA